MTLNRALSSLISSSSVHMRKLPLLRPFSANHSSRFDATISANRNPEKCTTASPPEKLPSSTPGPSSSPKAPVLNGAPARASVPPRPSEIPWQPKAANTVQLTGSISFPPKSVTSSDGVFTAISVIVQEDSRNPDLPDLWIPVIFQGTLAESAAIHLKEKDVIYVIGHLTRAAAPAPPVKNVPESGLQLIVSDFSIIPEKKIDPPHIPKKGGSKFTASGMQSGRLKEDLWKDLVTNPDHWIDCRLLKQKGSVNPKSPDFKQKDSGQALWVDSVPPWAYGKLDDLSFTIPEVDSQNNNSTSTSRKTAKSNGAGNKMLEDGLPWNGLVSNPHQWVDYRMLKQNGSINPRFPDFKNRENQQSLWLNTAPKSVLEKLDTLTFALPQGGIGRAKLTSTSWKNLTGQHRFLSEGFTKAPGVPRSHTKPNVGSQSNVASKPNVGSKGQKFEKARGRRYNSGFKV